MVATNDIETLKRSRFNSPLRESPPGNDSEDGDVDADFWVDDSLDAKNRRLARELSNNKFIPGFYGILNGFNDAYILDKFGSELLAPQGSYASDAMHDFFMTPGGIATVATETAAFLFLSCISNVFNENDERFKYIVRGWPYFREVLKAFRNSFKGIRSALYISSILRGIDLRYFLIPLAIIFGVLGALNKMWHRRSYKKRRDIMKKNNALLEAIQCTDIEVINKEWVKANLAKIQNQDSSLRFRAKTSVVFGAIIDSSYLYLGLMTVAALTPQWFIAMTVCCVLYAVVNIIVRVFEEDDYQRKLDESIAKIELAVLAKELEQFLNQGELTKNEFLEEIFRKQFNEKLDQYKDKLRDLHNLSTYSDIKAALVGLKSGLIMYSVVASLLFAVAMITSMCMVHFPPVLLITGVLLGAVCLATFVGYAIYENRKKCAEVKRNEQEHILNFNILKDQETFADFLSKNKINRTEFRDRIQDNQLTTNKSLLGEIEWCDVGQQISSGATKASKAVFMAGFWGQELNEKGYYQDSSSMMVTTGVMSALFAGSYGLRRYARVGKDSLADGYDFCLLPGFKGPIQSDKVYLDFADGTIEYRLLDPNLKEREGTIAISEFEEIIPDIGQEFQGTTDQFNKIRPIILDVLAKKNYVPLRYKMQLAGPEVCLMPDINEDLQQNKLYLELIKGKINYKILNSKKKEYKGEIYIGEIRKDDGSIYSNFQGSLEQFMEVRKSILDIIAKRKAAPLKHWAYRTAFFNGRRLRPGSRAGSQEELNSAKNSPRLAEA